MTKYTLNTAGLLILALFSTPGMAASPWATEEPAAVEPVNEPVIDNEPAQTEPMPVTTYETSRPGLEVVPDTTAYEPVEVPEPVVTTQTVSHGDVLNVNTSVASVSVLDFPRRGMSTDKVENELGRPAEIIPSVGTPPISRWIYDDRTVYFEYSSVIHVVSR